jgi:hypothetical protein
VKTLPTLQSGERTNTAGKPVRHKILLSVPNAEYRNSSLPGASHFAEPPYTSEQEDSQCQLRFGAEPDF